MEASFVVAVQHQIRKVASVVNNDVTGMESLEVADGAFPLIAAGSEIEIEGQPGLELVQATE